MHKSVEYIHAHAPTLREQHVPSDELGLLTEPARDILRDSGGVRLLQAKSHGGMESVPTDFFEWVRAVGRYNASAGWIAGVVGVHPFEVAVVDHKLQDEIYGADPDTWVASPYAPNGRAVPEGDGYRFSGQWQYSTGTDHCDWVVLGGLVTDANGELPDQPEMCHFFLPRGDYEIVDDSWHVMGLSGTGSKDIRIQDAWVPAYRTVQHTSLADGEYGHRRAETPVFQIPWGCMFSAAIASATFGIAQGALEEYREYMQTRISAMGVVGKTDPFQQAALGEVEADLAAGITHVDTMMMQWLDQVTKGDAIDHGQRLEFRRNQVRAVQRVLFGVDKLFASAGSAAVWTTRPLERNWRDLRTAGTHVCNMADGIYGAWANHEFDTGIFSNVMY
ncbi:MAG: acyl-CoA dehydrogenase [bacterium]|nr:acyl-CoA dehydrogenase [Gammaproteobacteria bacterium]HIL83964.1 acyl-CoA dehydrogenase [Pseudomonadales bacterium]